MNQPVMNVGAVPATNIGVNFGQPVASNQAMAFNQPALTPVATNPSGAQQTNETPQPQGTIIFHHIWLAI